MIRRNLKVRRMPKEKNTNPKKRSNGKHLRTLYGDNKTLKVTFYKNGLLYEVRTSQLKGKKWIQVKRYINTDYDRALKIFNKYYDEF